MYGYSEYGSFEAAVVVLVTLPDTLCEKETSVFMSFHASLVMESSETRFVTNG